MFEKINNIIKKIKIIKQINKFFLLLFMGIVVDITLVKYHIDLLTFTLTGLWILIVKKYKFKSTVSLLTGFGFLAACLLLLIFRLTYMADKTATWVYVFLTLGVLQTLWEYRNKND